MDAVEFIKTFKRFCLFEKQKNRPYDSLEEESYVAKDRLLMYGAEDMVEMIEKWAKKHPLKTRQSEFLKLFPDARLFDGVLAIDPCKINSSRFDSKECRSYSDEFGVLSCDKCREQFWNEEVE